MESSGSVLTSERCAAMIAAAETVVALTGAGISTAAGIPDFRGPDGLYVTRRYDPDRVFEIQAFRRDPEPFYEFTRDFLDLLDGIRPTAAHRFLAELERRGTLSALITQNIDPLHQQAGSERVIAVHGGYWTSRCLACGAPIDLVELRRRLTAAGVPHCACGGVIKPDVVFFGEAVHGMDEATEAVVEADLMLVLGSSLTVYPAALLPQYARGEVAVVNLGPVGLAPGPRRSFADADLDAFFTDVGAHLGW